MKIPKTIKIGNLIYKVRSQTAEGNDDYYGGSNEKYQWIELNFKLGEDKLLETFLHEIIHQILEQKKFTNETGDEKLVSTLASGLYQVLKDNNLLE